jgi:hypothetical protein
VVNLEFKNLGFSLNIINFYAPYLERIHFLENMVASRMLGEAHILLGGILNFTLSLREVWGQTLVKMHIVVFSLPL